MFSVKSCIKMHCFSAKVKRKKMKQEENSFSLYFPTIQNHSLNSGNLYGEDETYLLKTQCKFPYREAMFVL